jgi:hypothetical protein
MKSAVLGIVVGVALATLIVTGESCSISHRSGDYACTMQSECATGRLCVGGFCVLSSTIDAPGGNGDGPHADSNNGCPAACTSCNVAARSCTIDCSMGGCSGPVTCPTGYNCNIQGNTDGACRNGVDCQNGASCVVSCTGANSCRGVQCGDGLCNVACIGTSSCRNVACNSSCKCDVACTGTSSCADTIQCTTSACRNGLGCSSLLPSCHSC